MFNSIYRAFEPRSYYANETEFAEEYAKIGKISALSAIATGITTAVIFYNCNVEKGMSTVGKIVLGTVSTTLGSMAGTLTGGVISGLGAYLTDPRYRAMARIHQEANRPKIERFLNDCRQYDAHSDGRSAPSCYGTRPDLANYI